MMNRIRLIVNVTISIFVFIFECEPAQMLSRQLQFENRGYAESVHIYICVEALQLLKHTFPQINFSILDSKIGSQNDIGTRPWQIGKVATGAAREDIEDPVFDIRGPFGLEASCSHFWNADDRTNGDHSLTYLPLLGYYPNAFTKIQRYLDGDWHVWTGSGYGHREFINYMPGDGNVYNFSYHTRGLIQLYKTGRIWHESTSNNLGQVIIVRREIILSNYVRDIIVWEVIGRILHLKQDLSIPAHTHNDVHLPPPIPNDFDCYHEYIDEGGFINFNWMTAMNAGGFINPYLTNDDAIRNLVYTTTQVADHFPSGPDCLEIPQQHLGNNNLPGGTNEMIQNYYSELGPPPANISDLHSEGVYCFNHAIRASASFMYWFCVEAGIIEPDPNSFPSITSISFNLPDARIFHGETLNLMCNASGANLNYDWFIRVCDKENLCTIPVQGIVMAESGNSFRITNESFQNRWSCDFYDSLCNSGTFDAPPPLNFFIGVRASNQFGRVTKYANVNGFERFYPNQNLRPLNPPVSGCPFVLIKNETGYAYENDILTESEFFFNRGKDIEDKLIIKNPFHINAADSSIEIAFNETGIDRSYFDRVQLLEVSYPVGYEIGITKHKDIVMYEPEKNNSPLNAIKSGKDVTKLLIYDTLFRNSVKGKTNETLSIQFNNSSVGSTKKISDSDAVVFASTTDIPEFVTHVVKDIAGNIQLFDSTGLVPGLSWFSKRIFRSEMLIPYQRDYTIEGMNLIWNSDFDLNYIFTTRILYSGFGKEELEMISAESSSDGDVLDDLRSTDKNYCMLDTSRFIKLKFRVNSNQTNKQLKRKFVLCVTGRYEKMDPEFYGEGDGSFSKRKQEEENVSITPYPNPINSETMIKFDSTSAGYVVIKLYDIIGRELATIADDFLDAGIKALRFNTTKLACGIYFLKIESKGFSSVRKLVVIK